MKRKAYHQLLQWKSGAERKPLLIQGARQVGKTYLVLEFGGNEYEDCAYFNFEQTPLLCRLFESTLDPGLIVESLSAFRSKKISPQNTLIFFDEIQVCQRALTSLKYFADQAPAYHIIAAGSLLGVGVSKTSSFPVGKVNFLTLFPMSFIEFLEASGEDLLVKHLEGKKDLSAIPDILHEKLITFVRYFIFLGGMPEVVRTYIQKKDVQAARNVQSEILKAYRRDFSKHTTKSEAVRISEVFRSIPGQLARETKKFKYSEIKKGGRASLFESAIEWLQGAGIVYPAYCVKKPHLPLEGYAEHDKYKVFLLDTGLLGAMTDLHPRTIITGNELFTEYKGALMENYVATELVKSGLGQLYYWTSGTIAEVDFIVSHEEKILPLEVKSGMSRRAKSLRVYAGKYRPDRVYRLSPDNFTHDNDFVNIPLYAAGYFVFLADLS